jgi:thiol-disulfide isomerase/thioredoxin
MRRILFLFILLIPGILAISQETAMDFTRTDCDGAEHHLFSELDEGKVVILDFVMLGCAPCIWATRNLDTIVQSYEATHPGRVKLYAMSYESSHTCEQMAAWRTDGGFPGVSLFTDGAQQISYYGGMGMPTIVITGGTGHKVFYNGYGYTPAHDTAITAALDQALNYSSAGVMEGIPVLPNVYPTVFSDYLNADFERMDPATEFVLADITGRIVLKQDVSGLGACRMSTGHLPPGFYLGYLKGDGATSPAVKLIRK